MSSNFNPSKGGRPARVFWVMFAIAVLIATVVVTAIITRRSVQQEAAQAVAPPTKDGAKHGIGNKGGEPKEGKGADGKHEESEPVVALTDEQLKASAVTLATAAPGRIKVMLSLPGEIRYNEDRTAHVVPRVNGVVESVSANLGQQVKKGQILAVIASSLVSEQRSELLSARRRLALAQSTFEREKKLWEEKISAEQDYLQARQALQEAEIAVSNAGQKLVALGADSGAAGALNRYELRAPFDGMVMEKHLALGEAVKEDAQVFTLSDLSTVWAEINVSAKDLPYVRVGEKATVKATAFDASAEGTIAYVGSLLGEQTRTARGRVVLANPQGAWRPGLFASIAITASEADVPVAVPNEAVQTIENAPAIFVRSKEGFTARRVQVGRSDDKSTEVLQGLQKGEVYATGNTYTLKAEMGKGAAEHGH